MFKIPKPLQAVEELAGTRGLGGGVLGSLKEGGTVKKTGPYELHEGEKVVPKNRKKKSHGKAAAFAGY